MSGEATFALTVAAAVAVAKITRSGRPPPVATSRAPAALEKGPAPTATGAPNGSVPGTRTRGTAPRDVLRGRRG